LPVRPSETTGRERLSFHSRQLRAKLASRNEHKLRELQEALPDWELSLLEADDYPPEEGTTYHDNARAKARFGRNIAQADVWVLGEDSGLEVEGLGGGPGVTSSRFAPAGDFVERLLAELDGIEGEGRRARYVCELVALSPEREEFRGTGVLEGTIAHEPQGSEGFGYDPIFVPEGATRSVAQLGNRWKSKHSHRVRAARALVDRIGSR
jgi:XTP/dITP diphosphohydrolase